MRHEPPCQIDALDSLSKFKIAFHQCVSSYFFCELWCRTCTCTSTSVAGRIFCVSPALHQCLLHVFSFESSLLPSPPPPPPPPHRSLFGYLNEIGREAFACMPLSCKSHSPWLLLPFCCRRLLLCCGILSHKMKSEPSGEMSSVQGVCKT